MILVTFFSCSFIADLLTQVEGKPKCCFFQFSSKIQYNKLVKAQLWIYLRPVKTPATVFVQILRLIKPMKDGTRYTGIRSLKLDMNPGTGIWQSIDMKTVLQNWLKQPESNLGIEIKALDENGHDLAWLQAGLLKGGHSLISKGPQTLHSEEFFFFFSTASLDLWA